MTEYPKTVSAALSETRGKFSLCEALATEIPLRAAGGAGVKRSGDGGVERVDDLLEKAREAIIAAGGEAREVTSLRDYRLTALWVMQSDGSFRWAPLSYSAHNQARRSGLDFATWIEAPTRVDLERAATQRNNAAEVEAAKAAQARAEAALAAEQELRARAKVEAEEAATRAKAAAEFAAAERARMAAENAEIAHEKAAARKAEFEAREAEKRARLDAEEAKRAQLAAVRQAEIAKADAEKRLLEAKVAQERAEKAKADAEARALQQAAYAASEAEKALVRNVADAVATIVNNADKVTASQWIEIGQAQLSTMSNV